MTTRSGHSLSNYLAAILDPTHLSSQPFLGVSSSSFTSASSVPMPAGVLLLQHDLPQAFSQALGE